MALFLPSLILGVFVPAWRFCLAPSAILRPLDTQALSGQAYVVHIAYHMTCHGLTSCSEGHLEGNTFRVAGSWEAATISS